MMDNKYLDSWYPTKLFLDECELKCRWTDFTDIPFTDPFFDETMLKANKILTNSSIYKSTSNTRMLVEWAGNFDSVNPTAFIFHISRCGSTLLSQALSLNDDYIVLSEVPFIDHILRLLTIDDWLIDTEYQHLLRAVFNIYGQKRKKAQSRLFIKTDSWHLYYYPVLRLLYPDTPVIGLYRDPIEVLHSQKKKKGMHAIPGMIANRILGIAKTVNVTLDQHMVKVLESYLFSFIKISHENHAFFLFNYNEGILKIFDNFSSILTLEINKKSQQQLKQRLNYDAKNPRKIFKPETEIELVTPQTMILNALYYELEQIRNLQIVRINC